MFGILQFIFKINCFACLKQKIEKINEMTIKFMLDRY